MRKFVVCFFSLLLALPLSAATAFKLEGHQLVLPGPIVFKAGSAELDEAASKDALKHIQDYLTEKTYITTLRIEGHASQAGNEEANQKLSEARALTVARWLAKQGVDCQRLLAVGFGSTKPVADGSTPAGKAQNTRITIANAAMRGRAIGGLPVDGGGKLAGEICPK
jgi:OOP family OmpA-OmpF porin